MCCSTIQPTVDHLGNEVRLVVGIVAYGEERILVYCAQFGVSDLGMCIKELGFLRFSLELVWYKLRSGKG